jgi:hypothetical protein
VNSIEARPSSPSTNHGITSLPENKILSKNTPQLRHSTILAFKGQDSADEFMLSEIVEIQKYFSWLMAIESP